VLFSKINGGVGRRWWGTIRRRGSGNEEGGQFRINLSVLSLLPSQSHEANWQVLVLVLKELSAVMSSCFLY
jgi:hypothetical protein